MTWMKYETAFEREVRSELVPGLPGPGGFPATIVGLLAIIAGLPRHKGESKRKGSETGIAAAMIEKQARREGEKGRKGGLFTFGIREVQRIRVGEGGAPKGGSQERGTKNDETRQRRIRQLQIGLGQRLLEDVRRRGCYMTIEGFVFIKGKYREERDRIPRQFLPGSLLSQPWEDVDGEDHPAPLDALAALDYEEAAHGFDNAFWLIYDIGPDRPASVQQNERMLEGTFTDMVDWPGGLILEIGPEVADAAA